jgi:predicted lipid-binding transport protein (Tim44 family)
MRRSARYLAALAVLALALGPALAEARPGGGFSSGSRGSRTYNAPPATRTVPNTATRPFDRSATPETRPATPANPGYAGAAGAARSGGMFGGGFMAGMMGGLIGVGLGGLLFGNGLFNGIHGFGGILGLILQVVLVVWLVRFVMRKMRGRNQHAMAGGPRPGAVPNAMPNAAPGAAAGPYARQMQDMRGPGGIGGGRAPTGTPVQVGQADFQAFERLLREVNEAWSRRDEAALSRLTTPEMAGYFAGDLRDLAARNWANETSDVRLEQGDLSEAWREGNTEYATVAMRFSLIDVTRDLGTGQLVEGDPQRRQTVSELWTFARQGGGAWRLSAIQQPS